MSVHASSWAWNQSLSGKELIVLLYLADKAGDNGLSWYGRSRIAEKCGMSPRSVSRAMESLEQKELIKRFKRFTETGDQTSNATVVLFEGRIEEDDLGMMKEKNSYSPVDKGLSELTSPPDPENIGLSELTPPLVSTDNTPLSGLTTKTSVINISRNNNNNTTEPEKISLSEFREKLVANMHGSPVNKAIIWERAEEFHTRYKQPSPTMVAEIIYNDWKAVNKL